MTIASSGALTLTTIQTEFGGAAPIAMSEYYAGGAYVPSGTSGVNGAVPTSGAISFSKFYGTSDYIPDVITANFVQAQDITPRVIIADIFFYANGYCRPFGSDYSSTAFTWLNNSGNSANFDIRVTKTGGTGTLVGVVSAGWYSLGSTVSWTSSGGVVNFSYDIRLNATGTVIASNTGSVSIP